jgi:Domain of unknown function (DUF4438), N-terminal/Domain of unknown function (DUF4438), C-terminal
MTRKTFCLLAVLGLMTLGVAEVMAGAQSKAQPGPRPITTNKEKVLMIAVQGKIAAPQPSRSYITSWDGKSKVAIGIGGINYNLKLGDRVFGWAAADRATVGVAAEAIEEGRSGGSWDTYTSIGNEVKILSGKASGEKGVVIGKFLNIVSFGNFVLINFDDSVLEKLAIGDSLQVKACGTGLEIEGYKDVFVHGLAPDLLEKLGLKDVGGKLEVPVVKAIPAEIMGQGAGMGSLAGIWHIQTCYAPDIKKYGLDELRFGDIVLLQDVQTDYGKGYYKGGATVGVVSSGPSDMSGLGIGVTPILSTRFGKLVPRVEPGANIGRCLGIPMAAARIEAAGSSSVAAAAALVQNAGNSALKVLKTNKDELIVTAVQGAVSPTGGVEYTTGYDGLPILDLGMGSINYTVTIGDSTYGWAASDHVEPDVTIQGKDKQSPWEAALASLACIGNEAVVLSGEAAGAKGIYLGRHAGSDDKVWFPKEVKEKLALNDSVQVRAKGIGLKILGFEDVRVNKISPELLENMGITIEGGELVVPVVMEVPAHLMGSGLGFPFIEALDYDIQTTCPEIVEEYNLKKLRLGDVVAIRDAYDVYGPGRYEGAVTIATVIHGFSNFSGHGPGVNVVLSALPGKIKTRLDPEANTAYYLGIKARPK